MAEDIPINTPRPTGRSSRVALLVCVAWALTPRSGNADFRLTLRNGLQFAECNEIETVIADRHGMGVFSPLDYPNVGPIVEYAYCKSELYLHTHGRKARNFHANDYFEVADDTRDFYFVIGTRDNSVRGPLTRVELMMYSGPAGASISWIRPERPILRFARNLAQLFLILLSVVLLIFWWHTRRKSCHVVLEEP